MKHKIVKFNNGIARISTVTSDKEPKGDSNIFVNPDLQACKGISPELWTVAEGKIVPLDEKRRKERIKKLHVPVGTLHDRIKNSQKLNKAIKIALIINILVTIALLIKR